MPNNKKWNVFSPQALLKVFNFPTLYEKKGYEEWRSTPEKLHRTLRRVLQIDTTEGRKKSIFTFMKLIDKNFDQNEDKTEIINELEKEASKFRSKFLAYEEKYAEDIKTDLSTKDKTPDKVEESTGPDVSVSSFLTGFLKLVQATDIDGAIAYVKKNVQNSNSRLIMRSLVSDNPQFVSTFQVAIGKSTFSTENLKRRLTEYNENILLETLQNKYTRGDLQLDGLIKRLNSGELPELANHPKKNEILNRLLSTPRVHTYLKNTVLDSLTENSMFGKAVKDSKDYIDKETIKIFQSVEKNNKDSLTLLNTFEKNLKLELKTQLTEIHEKTFNAIFLRGKIPNSIYEMLQNQIGLVVEEELGLFGSFFLRKKITLTVEGEKKTFVLPILSSFSGVYSNKNENFNTLLKSLEIKNKRKEEEEAKEDNEKMLFSLEAHYPAKFKSIISLVKAEGFGSFAKSKLMHRGDFDPKKILIQHGGVVMGILFEKAMKDIDKKKEDPYYNPVYLKRLYELTKLTGTTRLKYFWWYTQANRMLEHLNKKAEAGNTDVSELMERPEIGTITPEKGYEGQQRPQGKDESRRRHKEQPLETFKQHEIEKNKEIQKYDPLVKINKKYKNIHDASGRPSSNLGKAYFDLYTRDYNDNKFGLRTIADSLGGKHEGFKNWIASSVLKNAIWESREEEIAELKETLEYKSYEKFLLEEMYHQRYLATFNMFNFTPTKIVNGIHIPIPTKPNRSGWIFDTPVSSGNIPVQTEKISDDTNQEAEIHQNYLTDKGLVLDEKFRDMTYVGMIGIAKDEKELNAIRERINTIVPEDILNTFQEDSGSMSISNLIKNRRDELAGLNNASGIQSIL